MTLKGTRLPNAASANENELALDELVREHDLGVFNVQGYQTIQDAVDDWLAGGGVLWFPPGEYPISSPIEVTLAAHSIAPRLISGYGATIKPTVSAGQYALDITSDVYEFRHLTIEGLQFYGPGSGDAAAGMLRLYRPSATGHIYRVKIRDVSTENCMGDGIRLEGNVFEAALIGCSHQASALTATGYGIHLLNNTGVVSSIDVYGCTTSGGKRGLYAASPVGDIKVYGGTYILAEEEGVKIDNGIGALLIGVHAENNWESGTASPGWSTSQAGIHVVGRPRLYHCYGTANNSKQRYVARTWAGASALVCGLAATGGIDYALRAEGSDTSETLTEGILGGTSGRIHNGITAGGTLIQLANEGSRGVFFPVMSDSNRGSPGTAGRIIFNTTDGNLNIDDGSNWILPDGTTT